MGLGSTLKKIAPAAVGAAVGAIPGAGIVAGPMAAKATSMAINKASPTRTGTPAAKSTLREIPQSAGSLGEARSQDKARMRRSYGI